MKLIIVDLLPTALPIHTSCCLRVWNINRNQMQNSSVYSSSSSSPKTGTGLLSSNVQFLLCCSFIWKANFEVERSSCCENIAKCCMELIWKSGSYFLWTIEKSEWCVFVCFLWWRRGVVWCIIIEGGVYGFGVCCKWGCWGVMEEGRVTVW